MRVRLDLELCSARVVGPRMGLPPDRLRSLGASFSRVHDRLVEAAEAGLLAHLAVPDEDRVTAWVAHGAGWRHRGAQSADRLVLLGEAGAVAALQALVPGQADLAVVDRPDAQALDAALAGAKRPRLLVVEGPAWVAALALPAAAASRSCTVLSDGAGVPCAIDGAERIEEPGAGDLRFGVLSAGALAVAGWARQDGPALARALVEAHEACTRRGVQDNPAFRLAAATTWLSVVLGLPAPALLLPSVGLQPWGEWARRSWAAFTSRGVPGAAGQERRGASPSLLATGDEALVQHLLEGPGGAWVVALVPAEGLGDAGSALLEAQVTHLVEGGLPVVRLRLPRVDGPTLAALSFLWVQAALAAAALDPVDPLTMDAADRWRERVQATLSAGDADRGVTG